MTRLKRFAAQVADTTDPQTVGLLSAVETVLIAVRNPDAELLVDPSSPHLVLLAGLVLAGVLDQSDADALVARGKAGVDVTDADVDNAKAAISRDRRAAAIKAACEVGQAAAANKLLADPEADNDALIGAWLTAARDALEASE